MNNVEAALVLLKNGANKDMQDNKVGRGPAWGPGEAGTAVTQRHALPTTGPPNQ